MIPPPAPARPLISASDISPCSYCPISAPLLFPASPAGGSQRRAEQNWTPRRPPTGCFRRLLLGLLGLWETEATSEDGAWARGGVDSTRLSARRAHRGPPSPVLSFR